MPKPFVRLASWRAKRILLHMTASVDTRYCMQCGSSLLEGPCACNRGDTPRAATRSKSRVAIAGVTLVALVSAGIALERSIQANGSTAATQHRLVQVEQTLSDLQNRIRADEAAATATNTRVDSLQAAAAKEQALSPTKIAGRIKPSVFTIESQGDLGSSFVVSSGSTASSLLTNFHVIADAWVNGIRSVKVRRGDQTFDGRITRVSEADDLALIEVDQTMPPLSFASAEPHVGDSVMAFGSPLGLEGTVSTGIVSALRHQNGQHLVQFTAAISPGNSGGPVVDKHGDVIGVAEMKVVGDYAEGLAFAIPSSTVCNDFSIC